MIFTGFTAQLQIIDDVIRDDVQHSFLFEAK